MIKVYKFKTILSAIILIIAITILLLNIINKKNTVATSNNIKNTYKILVDVEEAKLFLFENNKLIKTYKCSGGKASTPSPIGSWTIISKAKWGEGFRTEAGWD